MQNLTKNSHSALKEILKDKWLVGFLVLILVVAINFITFNYLLQEREAAKAAGVFGYNGIGTTNYPNAGLRKAATLVAQSDGPIVTSVIDEASGFAYFGIDANPAKIIKINLATLAKEDELILPETSLNNASVIDTANGFAYFSSNEDPGKIVKINLTTFTRVAAITLPSSNAAISAVIDTAHNFAYFGSANMVEPKIFKININPLNFALVDTLYLVPSTDAPMVGVIDTVNGYAYFAGNILFTISVTKVDIDPSRTFDRIGLAVSPSSFAAFHTTGVIDLAAGKAYFTDENRLCRVDLATFSFDASLDFVGPHGPPSAIIDTVNGKIYVGNYGASNPTVERVDLATFTSEGSLALNSDEIYLNTAVFDTTSGYAYFGTGTNPGRVVKLNLNYPTMTNEGAVILSDYYFSTGVVDVPNNFAYFGTYTVPGEIVKVDLNNFTQVGALRLNSGEDNLVSAVIDQANGYAYFGTDTNPGKVIKINLNTFSRVGAITLTEAWLKSAVIDKTNGYVYFGSELGEVAKVDVDPSRTFARIDGITLLPGEERLRSAVIDTSNGYAYFGTFGGGVDPKVVKVDVDPSRTFSRIDAIDFTATGEGNFTSAVIDETAGYAYFGTWTSPGQVVKININAPTFSRDSRIYLDPGEDNLISVAIDPVNNLAYFGTDTSTGKVIKIALNPLGRLGTLTLAADEGPLASAFLVDPYLYFGANSIPGKVIKVGYSLKGFGLASLFNLTEAKKIDYFNFYSHNAAGNLRLGLYGSSGDLLWQSNVIANTATNDWLRVSVPTSLGVLSPGTYVLAFQTDSTESVASYTAGPFPSGGFYAYNFGPFPDPLPSLSTITVTDELWSIYGQTIVSYGGSQGMIEVPTFAPSPERGLPAGINEGDVIKSADSQLFYYIGSDKKKHQFPTDIIFKTWFADTSKVKTISADDMNSIPIDSDVYLREGTYLVKLSGSPKVYAVEPGGVLKWITSERITRELYGLKWAEKVIVLSPELLSKYTITSSINSISHPTGSLISYQGSTKIYYIDENRDKREVSKDVFVNSHYQDRFVNKNIDPNIRYPLGQAMTVKDMVGYFLK